MWNIFKETIFDSDIEVRITWWIFLIAIILGIISFGGQLILAIIIRSQQPLQLY
jgi:hypothetical protein